eukprot:scaffold581_cov127-Skeletonema_marinoi.AAC.13
MDFVRCRGTLTKSHLHIPFTYNQDGKAVWRWTHTNKSDSIPSSQNPSGRNLSPHHHLSSSKHLKEAGLVSQVPINISSGLGIVWMVMRRCDR